MNILVVDDNENITKLFKQFLDLKNQHCTILNNGKNALALMTKEPFDKIVLDLAMPGFSGLDLLENIEDRKLLQKIIVMTASNITSEEEKDLLKKGIQTVLRKPISLEVIQQSLMD